MHAIVTACDKKYGDFLINHWLKSLKANVNLKNIEIIILDYGLTKQQKENIDAKIIKGRRTGHVVNIRFRDLANLLEKTKYDHVMMCDSGDIIFQSDISHLFKGNKMQVSYDTLNAIFNMYARPPFFSKQNSKKILEAVNKHKMINAGVILGPAKLFRKLAKECYQMIKEKGMYGPDQAAMHYLLHRQGFTPLNHKYNFVIAANEDFTIKKGVFYHKNKKIPIVHNAGKFERTRIISKFGYGPEFNHPRWLQYKLYRLGLSFVAADK